MRCAADIQGYSVSSAFMFVWQVHVMMGAPAAATRLESLTVEPISLISGEVELPGSKSLSNRVLLLSALAEVLSQLYCHCE